MKSIVLGATRSGVYKNLFRILARRWQQHAAHLSDPYRPERHYMRGPDPKCREMKAASAGASFVAKAE
jgi:hypothetical protein